MQTKCTVRSLLTLISMQNTCKNSSSLRIERVLLSFEATVEAEGVVKDEIKKQYCSKQRYTKYGRTRCTLQIWEISVKEQDYNDNGIIPLCGEGLVIPL